MNQRADKTKVSRYPQRATKVGVSNDLQWYLTTEDMPHTKEAWLRFLKKIANRLAVTQAIERATGVSVSPAQEQVVCTLASLTQERTTKVITSRRAGKQTTQPSAPKKAHSKKRADKSLVSLKSKRANSFGGSGDIERATHKCQEQRADVFKQIQAMSLQELVSAIRIARDKAYDEQPLSSLEKFLFDKFLNHDGDIETLAQKLKGKR